MPVVIERTALFILIVLGVALLAAVAAHAATHEIVPIDGFRPGTIVVKTGERRLYYVIDGGRALRFPVGVGKAGMRWTGNARVEGKYRPAGLGATGHRSAAKIRVCRESFPAAPPTTRWAMAALTLRGGEYAIHGTNRPELIGGFVSHGCIRMYNSRYPRALSPGRYRHAGDRRAMRRSSAPFRWQPSAEWSRVAVHESVCAATLPCRVAGGLNLCS